MKDSIIINMRYSDYDCLTGQPNVERHHVLMGQMRSKADEDGLWIPLTKQHHTEGSKPQPGVRCDIHHCELLRVMSQMLAQTAWEKEYITERLHDILEKHEEVFHGDIYTAEKEAREAFTRRYGRSYL